MEDQDRPARTKKPSAKARQNQEIENDTTAVWLGSGSNWDKMALKYLGVHFNPEDSYNLLSELKRRTKSSWKAAHQDGIFYTI